VAVRALQQLGRVSNREGVRMRRARVREHVAGAGAHLVQDDLRCQPARVVRGDRRHHRRVLRRRARAALTARRAAPRKWSTGGARGQGMPRRAPSGCTCPAPDRQRGLLVGIGGRPACATGHDMAQTGLAAARTMTRDRLKSAILQRQCLSMSRLGDFRSRCRMGGLCECSASTPCRQGRRAVKVSDFGCERAGRRESVVWPLDRRKHSFTCAEA